MKSLSLLFVLPVVLVACQGSKSSENNDGGLVYGISQLVEPDAGYYISNSEASPLLALSLSQDGSSFSAEALISNTCKDRVLTSYESIERLDFNNASADISVDSESLKTSKCAKSLSIVGRAKDTIEVVEDTGARTSFVLNKVDKESFVKRIQKTSQIVPRFVTTDSACRKSLGTDCAGAKVSKFEVNFPYSCEVFAGSKKMSLSISNATSIFESKLVNFVLLENQSRQLDIVPLSDRTVDALANVQGEMAMADVMAEGKLLDYLLPWRIEDKYNKYLVERSKKLMASLVEVSMNRGVYLAEESLSIKGNYQEMTWKLTEGKSIEQTVDVLYLTKDGQFGRTRIDVKCVPKK